MSEFAGQIMGGLSSLTAAGWGAVLAQLLGAAEGATGGGLPVLIAQFENAGLGERIQSWLHGGVPQAMTPGEVTQVLSAEQLAGLAQHSGLAPEELHAALAEILPHAVSHLAADATPGTTADVPGLADRLSHR